MFSKCDDPECPNCGCAASSLVRTLVKWGRASTRRRCDNCGVTWTVPAPVVQPIKKPAAAAAAAARKTEA